MIGIMICCCYKYKNQYEKVSVYWNNIEKEHRMFRIFYLFGNPKIEKNEYNSKTKQLILKVEDNYESLPKKIYEAINYINLNFPEIEGIYKTDDDIEVKNIDELLRQIKLSCVKNINYCGLVVDKVDSGLIKETRLRKFSNKKLKDVKYDASNYCYGAGYYISKKSMNYIGSNKDYMYEQYLEDVSIGHILNKYKIHPTKIAGRYKEIRRVK
ncbi:galactosyltransferase [Catovirus CTV1]|uniref:Galactosyltransferase n=1 Tax=Catovirus CTV1 TaxID=1977631 RepID=A0A1V0SAJ7_9VIRU|nr:galactosyltransferase [Catovirus CTV1]